MSTTAHDDFPDLSCSLHASRTLQPLTELTDKLKPSRSAKPLLKLSMGDPTADGNLVAPAVLTEALLAVVKSEKFNGYPPVAGYDAARAAVANYWTRFATSPSRRCDIVKSKVLLTSGGSHAIVLAITAIANAGDNVLIPAPAFPHYKTVCDSYGIECRSYPLKPERKWEADLQTAMARRDGRTRAMLMVNPSNPCGSNFSREHVGAIVSFCEAAKLPLISDEIYAEVVFKKGERFTSVADFDTPVPRVVMGGSAKHAVTPGWRLGWILFVDTHHHGANYFTGMDRLAQLMTGSNSISQMAVANALLKTPPEHLNHLHETLAAGAKCYNRLLEHNNKNNKKSLGITFDEPVASMFVMLQLDLSRYKDIASDMEFYEKLLDEENVQLLPGSIFGVTGFLRATTSRPKEIIDEAIDRIILFAERHLK